MTCHYSGILWFSFCIFIRYPKHFSFKVCVEAGTNPSCQWLKCTGLISQLTYGDRGRRWKVERPWDECVTSREKLHPAGLQTSGTLTTRQTNLCCSAQPIPSLWKLNKQLWKRDYLTLLNTLLHTVSKQTLTSWLHHNNKPPHFSLIEIIWNKKILHEPFL